MFTSSIISTTVARTVQRALSTWSGACAINSVGVIGAGLMGSGIAQIAAASGNTVKLVDANDEALGKGMAMIEGSLARLAAKKAPGSEAEWTAEVMSRVSGESGIEALHDVDLVVEAIVENMDIKKNLFAQLGDIASDSAILASNTSSLSITELGEASNRPESMVGLHFFNPVPLMALVEVVNTPATAPGVLDASTQWAKDIGKVPITCSDTPGFVVNRLLVPYMGEALRMLERGVASAQDIDTGMKLGAGHPMGPIQLADYVGLDTCLFILEGWSAEHPDVQAFAVPEILRQKVEAGQTGRKVGQGFYKWDGDRIAKQQ